MIYMQDLDGQSNPPPIQQPTKKQSGWVFVVGDVLSNDRRRRGRTPAIVVVLVSVLL